MRTIATAAAGALSLLLSTLLAVLTTAALTPVAQAAPVARAAPEARAAQAGEPRRAAVDLRVGSYNVRSVSLDGGGAPPWRERRQAVIGNILGENLDVLGVQEVNPSKAYAGRLVDGPNQFLDLRNGLNAAGGSFALTNRHAFNCKKPATQHRCQPKNRGASHAERILYNTRTVALVDQGKVKYDAQVGSRSPGYLAWAVLRSQVSGTEFLFTTTHLEPQKQGVRARQWRQMIAEINRVKDGRPVIATGDFNTHKFSDLARTFLPRMKRAGYGDVLDQHYREGVISSPRAASTVNGWMNTVTRFSRDVRTFGYHDKQFRAGNNIDWIWADNALPVREWKVVTAWDPATWQVTGVLPSDHNMVRATIGLG